MPLNKDYFNQTFEEQLAIDLSDVEAKEKQLKELNASIINKITDVDKIIHVLSNWGFGGFLPGKIGKFLAPVKGFGGSIFTILFTPQNLSDPNIITSYVNRECESRELIMNSIFKGPTRVECLKRMDDVLLAPEAMYKSFFQKQEDNPLQYIKRLSDWTHVVYSIADKDGINKIMGNKQDVPDSELAKYLIYKDQSDENVFDVMIGGFILKAIFKNFFLSDLKELGNQKPKNTNEWWNQFLHKLYGLNNINKRYKHVPEYLRNLYVTYFKSFESKEEKTNPLVKTIYRTFYNAGLNGYYGTILAYFLLYNVCTINFQMYVYNQITWEEYVNNCMKLIRDITGLENQKDLLVINVSKYINVDLFKKFYSDYPILDVLQLNYSYVKKNRNNLFLNLLRHRVVLKAYVGMRKFNPFALILTSNKLIFGGQKIGQVIKDLKGNSSMKWYYVLPTIGLLIATILILYKINQKRKIRR